jgi:OPA family glycerol-3-phosphate transporter-like MFS transporter
MPQWLQNFAPILLLLAVVAVVIVRLPKVEGVAHDRAYRMRRVANWLPLGLTYAFLYMGRYNLKVSEMTLGDIQGPSGAPLMSNADFGVMFGIGTATYGCAFLLNGPLTDRFGGKKAIVLGALGAALANLAMGLVTHQVVNGTALGATFGEHFLVLFSLLYAVNMYFQAFGAVAVVKVNAPWFHVRERGVIGAIFGILISLGLYFAYDVGYMILKAWPLEWVFLTPALLLLVFTAINGALVQDSPSQAGLKDFDTGDATEDGPRLGVVAVFKKMLTNPIILTIAFIEFCSGFLRQAVMQWFRTFAKQTDAVLGLKESFVYENWGMLLCVCGILGGVVAGVISDHLFQSRRGPVAAILYGGMLLGTLVLTFTYTTPGFVGPTVLLLSTLIIGVHGMLSGTASMDFGGKHNTGVAVGIIDGFVYAGTAVMSFTYAIILPETQLDANGKVIGESLDPANWIGWPVAMIPFALIGLVLSTRVWNARPRGAAAAH